MNEALSRFSRSGGEGFLTGESIPALDLSETDGKIEIKMDLPGIKPEEISIEVRGDTLHISGEHKEEKEEKDKTFYHMERHTGSFDRTVTLPCAVDESKVDAECHDGVLTVSLPKTAESQMHKIKVKG